MKKTFLTVLMLLALTLVSCNLELFTSKYVDQVVVEEGIDASVTFDGSSPTSLTATSACSSDTITLVWSAVKGADYYEISRRSEHDASYTLLPFIVESTSYADRVTASNSLSSGTRYWYKVNARSNSVDYGENINYSPEAVGSLLASPSDLMAEKGKSTSGIMLSWSTVPDVVRYNVYQSSSINFDKSDSYEGTILANSSSDVQKYSFKVDESEQGVELYFKVTSIGPNGMETELGDSPSAIGYSLVYGAPAAPSGLEASQGVGISATTTPLTVTWTKDDSVTSYQVYRSSEGTSEKLVYPFSASDSLTDNGDGTLSFVDKRAKNIIASGTKYTYTVIPIGTNDKGVELKGSTASAESYLLSNPEASDISLSLSASPAAYVLSFLQAVGLETTEERTTHASWKYLVNCESESGLVQQVVLNPSDYGDTITYTVPYDTTGNASDQFTIFSIQVKNTDISLTTPPSAAMTISSPTTPDAFTVSSNTFINGMTANANGVYPIHISWTKNGNIDHYILKAYDGSSLLGTVDNISGSASSYDYANDAMVVGSKYSFTIQAFDVLGRSSAVSSFYTGYGAVKAETFLKYWTAYAFKPWENSWALSTSFTNSFFSGINLQEYWVNGGINTLVQKGNSSSLSDQMNALGDATQTCHYAHGTHAGASGSTDTNVFGSCAYHAEMEGVGGAIKFTYADFGEVSYMSSSGAFEMHVNASGTGSASSDGFTVTGMYPAVVKLGNIKVVSKSFVGNYSIKMSDGQGTVSVTCVSYN